MLIRSRFPLLEEHEGGASGGAGAGNGGADAGSGSGEGNSDSGEGRESSGMDPAAYKRMQDDLVKAKRKLQSYEDEKKKREADALKEQGRWKEAAERAEKERDEALNGRSEAETLFRNTLKSTRVVELALKAGLKEAARDDLDSLDLDEIECDKSESGRYTVRGADRFVENLKKRKPHWFGDAKPPTFNAGGGKAGVGSSTGGDGPADAKSVWELEKKYGRKDPRFLKAWNSWMESRAKKK